jgi:hypothetical protein
MKNKYIIKYKIKKIKNNFKEHMTVKYEYY